MKEIMFRGKKITSGENGKNWADSLHRANEVHTLEVIGNIHDNSDLIKGAGI